MIDETLVASQPAFLAGVSKVCKTLLGIDAAISLATGLPFLGVREVPTAVRVAYFSGEGGLSVLQEYGTRIAAAKGIALEDVGGLLWCDRLPQLGSLAQLDALREFLTDNEIGAVFLDPVYLCFPGDDNNNLIKQGDRKSVV